MLAKHAHPLRALTLALLFSAVAPYAHAGTFEWVDDMFTFREDQKERVSPRRNLPPVVVLTPDYRQDDHQSWSGYYTRQDLVPQNYIAGSASKVMRPIAPPDGGQGGQYGGYGQPQPGGSTYIGDPGTGPGMVLGQADAQVGAQTRIGPAVQDWRSGGQAGWDARPGDYDYRMHGGNAGGDCCQRDYRAAPNNGYGNGNVQWSGNNGGQDSGGAYYRYNSQGQVTGYRVQQGDTLSGISAQPKIYDNWRLWPLIYSANRKVIGRDPDVLLDGQKLGIPRDYSTGQARAAERKADAHGQGVYGDGR
jgi:nucleoid-associated protein YgaU